MSHTSYYMSWYLLRSYRSLYLICPYLIISCTSFYISSDGLHTLFFLLSANAVNDPSKNLGIYPHSTSYGDFPIVLCIAVFRFLSVYSSLLSQSVFLLLYCRHNYCRNQGAVYSFTLSICLSPVCRN